MPIAIDSEFVPSTNTTPAGQLVSFAAAWRTATGELATRLNAVHEQGLRDAIAGAYDHGAILHTAPADAYVFLRAFPDLLPHIVDAYANDRVFDIATREKLIDIAEGRRFKAGGYDLGALAKRRAGVEVDKNDPWRMRYGELLGLEISQWPRGAQTYALGDPWATLLVFEAQEALRFQHTIDVFADASRQARGHIALYAQTLRGIRTDATLVGELDERLRAELTRHSVICLQHGLAEVGGTKKAPRIVCKKAPATEMLLKHCAAIGVRPHTTKPTKTAPEGNVSLGEDALVAARIPPGHPLDSYRRKGAIESTRTKNIPVLRRPLIRTRYNECVDSGRTSSSGPQGKKKPHEVDPDEWIGTNLQNQNRKGGFRECLIAPPGHVFVISDWSAAELVALAQVQIDLFGSSALGDILRAGRNPHSEFAALEMLAIPLEQFDHKNNKGHADARQGAKAFNFGKPGGMGQKRFIAHALDQYGFIITPERERELDARWHRTLPEMRMLFDYVKSLQGPGGWITIIQPRSGRIRGRCRFTDACNTHFQGLAADAAKLSLWWLWLAEQDPRSPLFGGQPLVRPDGNLPVEGQCLFVHDEHVTVIEASRAEAAKAEQERIMVAAFQHWCPDVPIKVESVISERYTK